MDKKQKRIIIIITLIFFTMLISLTMSNSNLKPTYSASCPMAGDVNSDGKTDVTDAKLIALYTVDKSWSGNIDCADVNGDSAVKLNDATYVTKRIIKSVSLSKSKATIYVNGKLTLKATVKPTNALNKTITWSSSDTSVATVNNGTVTGISAGTATITATTTNGKKATCNVTVESGTTDVTDISLSDPQNTDTYYVNGKYNIKVTLSPSNAVDYDITWTSSNPAVATVTSAFNDGTNANDAIVTTLTSGTTTITAKTSNDKTATFTLIVSEAYIKEDDYPYIYKDGSAELTITKETYTSPITEKTTEYHLAHLKTTDFSRLHTTDMGNQGQAYYDTCGRKVYKADRNTGEETYIGYNCGAISTGARKLGAVFAVEGDYSLNGGHSCNKIKGKIMDGEYYYTAGNQQDLTQISASGIGYGFYSKKTGVLGPTSALVSPDAATAVSTMEATDSICFQVNLVVDGKISTASYLRSSAHRQANFVGYKGPGDIYFVISEGAFYTNNDDIGSDGKSYGLVPKDRAQILLDLGCSYGAQLDGGYSIIVWFKGKQEHILQSQVEKLNYGGTERDWLTDFVYFK